MPIYSKKNKNPIALGIIVAFILTVLLSPPLMFSFEDKAVILNQHIIESDKQEYGARTPTETLRAWFSYQTLAWNQRFHSSVPLELDVNNTREVFNYVFEEIPYYAIVYPTETYYYYKIPKYGIAGNLRFVDIDKGVLYFAYYYEDTPHADTGGSKEYTIKDGIFVSHIGDNLYKVNFRDKTVYFKLPTISDNPPKKIDLKEDEEFVAKIQDESGVLFHLVFNTKTNGFYYLFDEDQKITDSFEQISDEIFVGQRTGFAYYLDPDLNRKILFGVATSNIFANNYFDGPFDQVPPHLPIREKLYLAYPYTQYLHGLDEHGNFIDFEGSRVAISAYANYYETTELQELVEECKTNTNKSEFLACLTYEPKKDFHKTMPEFFDEDGTCKDNCLLKN
ncbi:MAG: hypothetical protein ABH864_05715 [archaeon]